jgi:hypothetical protein
LQAACSRAVSHDSLRAAGPGRNLKGGVSQASRTDERRSCCYCTWGYVCDRRRSGGARRRSLRCRSSTSRGSGGCSDRRLRPRSWAAGSTTTAAPVEAACCSLGASSTAAGGCRCCCWRLAIAAVRPTSFSRQQGPRCGFGASSRGAVCGVDSRQSGRRISKTHLLGLSVGG